MIKSGVILSMIFVWAAASQNAWEMKKDNTEDQMMVEATAAKRKIISYNKSLM